MSSLLASWPLCCAYEMPKNLPGSFLHSFVDSDLIQSHLLANRVADVGAEELTNSHLTHVGAPQPWLLAVDARISQPKLFASLHPLEVHHHQKASCDVKGPVA